MSTAADSEDTSATVGAAGAGSGCGAGPDAGPTADSAVDASQAPSGAAASPRVAPSPAGLVFDDPFDRPSADDTDRGWGDPTSGSADDDFTRFLSEKPPHHI
ncbi:hypothetical protein [Actinacidiphila paucisporea]|uniref:Acetyl-CoA synthetase n=1 Tax=Actinacidiphila paucisporea TaxID=310782 RepID=A0A1M7EVW2_9ACTN|nr:hypothetical protein [Actinacidiphila paucisporea]SHL95747.1 acetyl-CoA synthetase [Actinacidiphila paucisporea]